MLLYSTAVTTTTMEYFILHDMTCAILK